jgi:hypothetical protein
MMFFGMKTPSGGQRQVGRRILPLRRICELAWAQCRLKNNVPLVLACGRERLESGNAICDVQVRQRRLTMATAKKIDLLTVKLDPKPGALAQALGTLREAKVNLIASWGYQMGPGEAQAHFFTGDLDRAKQALTKAGKTPKTESAFWVEDADKIGAYHGVLQKLAQAGINVEATDAFAIGGKFATVIFVAEGDVPKAAKALGV